MHDRFLLLTIPEVAYRLSLSPRTVYRLIDSGDLESVKIRRNRRVRQPALERYLNRLQSTQRAQSVGFDS